MCITVWKIGISEGYSAFLHGKPSVNWPLKPNALTDVILLAYKYFFVHIVIVHDKKETKAKLNSN